MQNRQGKHTLFFATKNEKFKRKHSERLRNLFFLNNFLNCYAKLLTKIKKCAKMINGQVANGKNATCLPIKQ